MVNMACIMGRFMVFMMFVMLLLLVAFVVFVVLAMYRLIFKAWFNMVNRRRWVGLWGNISRNIFFAADVLWYYAQHRSLCGGSCLLCCAVAVRLLSGVLLPR